MCASYLLIFIFIDLQSQEEVLMLEREEGRRKTVRQSDFPGVGVLSIMYNTKEKQVVYVILRDRETL